MLTPEEVNQLNEFLAPSRIAVVATIGRDGMPQLTPNWYHFSNGVMTISTTKERIKYTNLSRDARMSVCVYSEPRAAEYAVVRGSVTIADDDTIWDETMEIVKRYVAAASVEDRMSELKTQDRVLISLKPEKVAFRSPVLPRSNE